MQSHYLLSVDGPRPEKGALGGCGRAPANRPVVTCLLPGEELFPTCNGPGASKGIPPALSLGSWLDLSARALVGVGSSSTVGVKWGWWLCLLSTPSPLRKAHQKEGGKVYRMPQGSPTYYIAVDSQIVTFIYVFLFFSFLKVQK